MKKETNKKNVSFLSKKQTKNSRIGATYADKGVIGNITPLKPKQTPSKKRTPLDNIPQDKYDP